MYNFFMRWLFMLSCLISSLAAINAGLMPFGYNFFQSDFVLLNMSTMVPFMQYVVLAAGLISLGCFIFCSASGHRHHHGECNDKSCKSCK